MLRINNFEFSTSFRENNKNPSAVNHVQDKDNMCNLAYLPYYRPFTPSFNARWFNASNNKFQKAKEYFNKKYDELEDNKKRWNRNYLSAYNLDTLDGIQEGIPVFKGMTMKEIYFLTHYLKEIAVHRGCHNMCVHCYAEAKPPLLLKTEKDKSEKINQMSYEDYCALAEGFKELDKRLKGLLFEERELYLALFHDADCSDISIKDKQGNEHDFTELVDIMYEATQLPQVFDTSGWNPKDKKVQQKMEKLVQYFLQDGNSEKFCFFNVSLNPFHSTNARYVKYIESDPQKAMKYRNIYTDRMANVLYTLTPIIRNNKFEFISRAFDNTHAGGYTEQALKQLIDEILVKLENKYIEDIKCGNLKYVKNMEHMKSIMETIKNKAESIDTLRLAQGRAVNLVDKDDILFQRRKMILEEYDIPESAVESSRFNAIIDANGKVYMTNYLLTYPTEIQLNFENKNKKTADIKPDLQEKILSKAMIEKKF